MGSLRTLRREKDRSILRHIYHSCEDERCYVCVGGLTACDVCNGAEITLTTHCVGRPLTEQENHEISHGRLNYREGLWRDESNYPRYR